MAWVTDTSDDSSADPVAAPTTVVNLPTSSTATETPTSTVAPTTLAIDQTRLSELVPGVDGTFHALVADSLIEIPSDPTITYRRAEIRPLEGAGHFSFDASNELLAFLKAGQDTPGLWELNIWSVGFQLGPGDVGVTSYRWHQTRPRHVAAVTVDFNGRAELTTFTFDQERLPPQANTITAIGDDQFLVAWGDYGFVVVRYDPLLDTDVTSVIDHEGNVVWQSENTTALDASPNQILILRVGGEHAVIDATNPGMMETAETLFTLPHEGTVTGSDFASDGQLAVHYPLEGRNWNLRIYDADLTSPTDVELAGWRVWDLTWSPDNRFILMPGTDDEGRHVVVFYDTSTRELSFVDFHDWVHWAALTPAP